MVIKIGKIRGSSKRPEGVDPNDYVNFYQCTECKYTFEIENVLKGRGKPVEKPCPKCGFTARHWSSHKDAVSIKKEEVN